MFVDASIWVAILVNAPEASTLEAGLQRANEVLISPIVTWETARAVAKTIEIEFSEARELTQAYMALIGSRIVAIGGSNQSVALEAHARFGKCVHPAKLNMGDGFAYACARTNGVPLLYKGEDFALTDIERA